LRVYDNFVFYPPHVRAKQMIEAGEIGEPQIIRMHVSTGRSKTAWRVPLSAWAWRFDKSKSGGGPLVFDDGHHKFSLAWYFMGMAEEVHAWIGRLEAPLGGTTGIIDTPAIISWKFPRNRYGSLEVVYSPEMTMDTRHYAQDDRIEITGSKGVIWITRGHGKMMDVPPVVMYKDMKTYTFSDMPAGWEYSFIYSTRHFINAYFRGEPPSLTGEQGREILRFALAAQESARVGAAVRL